MSDVSIARSAGTASYGLISGVANDSLLFDASLNMVRGGNRKIISWQILAYLASWNGRICHERDKSLLGLRLLCTCQPFLEIPQRTIPRDLASFSSYCKKLLGCEFHCPISVIGQQDVNHGMHRPGGCDVLALGVGLA